LVTSVSVGSVEGLRKGSQFKTFLAQELERRGFRVAGNIENTDAVLDGVIETMLVLDGDETDIVPDTLRFRLTSKAKREIWKAKMKVRGQSIAEKDDKYKAQKLAERIWRDLTKAAKNARETQP